MIKETKIENFKSKDLIRVECDYCGNELKRKKHHALAYDKHYCDNTCRGNHKAKQKKQKIVEIGAKECVICKEEKSLCDYNIRKDSSDGLQNICKHCQQEHARNYYLKNKEKQKEQISEARKKRINENREKYFNILSSNPCVDCGETNPIVLEFDHKYGFDKVNEVGKLVGDGSSWEKIEIEMIKCEVRCANCHRIRTAKQYGWYKDLLQKK